MTDLLFLHIQQRLSEITQTNLEITECKQVFGGDINRTAMLKTGAGNFFVKYNHSLPEMFQKEYNGLQLLRETNALKIPKAFGFGYFEGDSYLVMECLEAEKSTPATWEKLGKGLATLHQHTQPKFGLAENNFIGSLPQLNSWRESWADFYTTQRLLPLLQIALQQRKCTITEVKQAERLCKKLENIFPEEPPALLHGDLWSGNVMSCAVEEVAIYDPAVYYGNREMDIAMTLLFGGFDARFYSVYNETYPLQHGWRARTDVCQLYPLLVHLILFGGSYYQRVKTILAKYD